MGFCFGARVGNAHRRWWAAMIHDNSDTTHLDAYPVKRAWSQLPWWFRWTALTLAPLVLNMAMVTAAVVTLFRWISTDGVSSGDAAASVFSLAVYALAVVLVMRHRAWDAGPAHWFLIFIFGTQAVLLPIALGLVDRVGLGADTKLAVAVALIPAAVLVLAFLALFAKVSFQSAREQLPNSNSSSIDERRPA